MRDPALLRWTRRLLLLCVPAFAQAAPTGWVMSLEWSPQVCHDKPGIKEPQCRQVHGFVLGSLEPTGNVEECVGGTLPPELLDQGLAEVPNRESLRRMWRRGGTCSGLDAREWTIQVGRAARRWVIPSEYGAVHADLVSTQDAIAASFSRANPELAAEHMVPDCRRSFLRELRICMDADFEPRDCRSVIPTDCREQVTLRAMPQR